MVEYSVHGSRLPVSFTDKFQPGTRFPEIILPLAGGGHTEIGTPSSPENWKLVVIYRGVHCPLCTRYLETLEGHLAGFAQANTEVIAVSADSETKASAYASKHGFSFPVASELTLIHMRQLGLYVSLPAVPGETDGPFAEPALFVLDTQGIVHVVEITNAPFVRPDLELLCRSVGYMQLSGDQRHDGYGGPHYPIRGGVAGSP